MPNEIELHFSQEAAVIGKRCSTFRLLVISDENIAKNESAHICIQNISDRKIIGKIFLATAKPPKTKEEIITVPKDILSSDQKNELVNWANSFYRNTNITNWEQSINLWKDQLETYNQSTANCHNLCIY